ncbi:thioesterase II family protein [Microbispora sp. NPDC049125]|uniref:thioesterase II family protein n=1 Tax=Microbispora sp. NPDC049125 TaxID=3154929 RepID=UPI003465C4FD
MTNTNDDSLWVRRFHQTPRSDVRLVCFPHAGGSASFYHPVSEALSGTVEVLALQYPGRQDRRADPCVDDIADLADQIHEALWPWADRPLAFFGHSMGAILAFEVARRFEWHDRTEMIRIFASGRRSPSSHRVESVHRRSDSGIVSELQSLSGTDSRLLGDPELLSMILPAIRSDYKAIETYRCAPGATVNCPIDVFVGDDDPKTTLDEARAWAAHTTADFEMTIFPGGHFYLASQQARVISAVADKLSGARV